MSEDRTVLIAGAGQGGYQAALSLRDEGFDGPIRIVGEETYAPYQRPPLSKETVKEQAAEDLAFCTPEDLARNDIELVTGRRVVRIDRIGRHIELQGSGHMDFHDLVLATGARNRALPLPSPSGVCSVRGLDDALELRDRLAGAENLVVIGGGFLGLELASMAAGMGLGVDVVEATDVPMGRAVSSATSAALVEHLRKKGIRIHTGAAVAAFESSGGRLTGVRLDEDHRLPADVAVVSIGVVPNSELATECGLAVDNGILVDTSLRTADPHIHAIGDCAAFPSERDGRVIRLESVQNAVDQGCHVAREILGRPGGYERLPLFWSEQGGVRLQIAGLSIGYDDCVTLGDREACDFSSFCFRDGHLIAVESVNRPADHMSARRCLNAGLAPARSLFDEAGFDFRAWVKVKATL